jgi:hypothetical protein
MGRPPGRPIRISTEGSVVAVAQVDFPAGANELTAETARVGGDGRRGDDDLRERIRQLQTALESRVVIEQAKGRLAERFQLPIDDAFSLLRFSARASRMSLRTLAEIVAEHPEVTPEEIVATLARSERWRAATPSRGSGRAVA